MTEQEWANVKRMLLQWPQPANRPIDDGAYLRCLRRFSAPAVANAVESMIDKRRHTPLAEIAAQVRAMNRDTGSPELDASWESCRTRLLEVLGERTFGLWLDPLRPIAFDNVAGWTLTGPAEVVGWVASRMRAAIESCVGTPVSVEQSAAIGAREDGE